jgi:hypothetical protein
MCNEKAVNNERVNIITALNFYTEINNGNFKLIITNKSSGAMKLCTDTN